VAELALDDVERHPFAREFDGVGVAQLVRSEAAPDAGAGREPAELDAHVGARPRPSGTKSACTGACASAWPPLRASAKPTVGAGARASIVGKTPRSDGQPQVTYHGHPLYTYTGDQNPGDTNGQGLTVFGGGWFAVSPAGDQVSGTGSSGGATGY
jgi:hypothetical protein